MDQPDGFSVHRELEKESVGWDGEWGGGGVGDIALFLVYSPRFYPGSLRAVRSFTTRTGTGGSWIESQRPLRKQETQTVASAEHRAQEEEHNAHRTRGGSV